VSEDTYTWREMKRGEWWHDQNGPREPHIGYPPDAYVSFPADEAGKPLDAGCLHYYRLWNGTMPGEDSDETDYVHICGAEGLDELIASLGELRRKLYGDPPSGEEQP
jgi:hypothetical protein